MSAPPRPLSLRGHTGPLLCLAFHPLRPALLASSSEAEILLWDLASPQAPALASAAASAALGLAQGAQQLQWWPGGGELALLLGSGARVLQASLALPGAAPAGAAAPAQLLATCGDDVAALCLHPTLPLCAACDDEGAVTLIGLAAEGAPAQPPLLRVLRRGGHTSLCTGALFSPCGAALVSGGCDQRLLVWEASAAAPARAPLLDERLPDLLLLHALEGPGSGGGGGGGGEAEGGFGPGVNPPHILSLVAGPRVPPGGTGSGGSLLAAALGDGAVAAVALAWAPPKRRGGGGGGGAASAPRPGLAVQWVDRSSVSPACALASVEVGGASSSGSAPRSVLVSASNSGALRAWDWAALAAGAAAPLAAWAHGEEGAKRRKINWMAGSPAAGGLLAVADTGRRVTVYALAALLPPPAPPGK